MSDSFYYNNLPSVESVLDGSKPSFRLQKFKLDSVCA